MVRSSFITAVICLVTLFVEITLDPSTPFVRSNPQPTVGKLVVVKTSIEKKQSIPHLQGGTTADPTDQGGFPDDNSDDDLIKFSSADAHAGQITMPVYLSTPPQASWFIPRPYLHHEDLCLPSPQRPPSV